MTHRFGYALLACALGVSLATTARAETRPTNITIATEGAYEPWNFITAGGKITGFEIDLANNLCTRMKVTCKIVAQDWDSLIPSLVARKFDAIMASMIVTPARLKVIAFSKPYAPTSAAFMVDKSGPLAKLPGTGTTVDLDAAPATVDAALAPLRAALKDKTIGAQVSTANVAFLDKYFKGVVQTREYKTVEDHNLDLQAGRIDGVVAQKTSINTTLLKPGFTNYTIAGPTFVNGMFGQGIAAGLRKDDTVLKSMFDQAIAAAQADGTINQLAKKWFKTELY